MSTLLGEPVRSGATRAADLPHLRGREDTLATVARPPFVARSSAEAVDPVAVLDRIVAEALVMIERADGASIEVRNGEMLEYVSGAGTLQPFVGLLLRIDGSFSGRCLSSGQVVRCDDALDDDRVDPDAVRRTGVRSMLCVPLHVSGRTDAVLKVSARTPHAFTDCDADDLRRLAEVLSIAVSAAADLSQVSEERLALAEQLVRLGEHERHRLALALHDDPVQRLTAALYELSLLRPAVPADRLPALQQTESLLRNAITSLRLLMFELAPPDLDPSNLDQALELAAEELFAGTQVDVAVDATFDVALELRDAQLLYRIAVESLGNVRRHAKANHVTLRGRSDAGGVTLEVIDDGCGFDADTATPGHLGLSSLRERGRLLGGTVTINSSPGTGTRIALRVPPPSSG